MTSAAPEKILEDDVGTWDADVIVRPGPGAPEQRSTGVAVQRLVGGRWLVVDFKNETSGFDGHGIYGWDAARKAYVGTWVDPMRTFLTIMEGAWDPETRTMTYHAEARLPDGRVLTWREATVKDGDVMGEARLAAVDGEQHHRLGSGGGSRARHPTPMSEHFHRDLLLLGEKSESRGLLES